MSRTFSQASHGEAVLYERGSDVATQAVCGYLRKEFMMSSRQVAVMRRQIVNCARKHGLEVDKIFVQEVDRASDQLVECVYQILGADEPTIIVPSLLHFAGYGSPLEVKRDFESQGIKVLIAWPDPESKSPLTSATP